MTQKVRAGRPRKPRPDTLGGEIGAIVERLREQRGLTQPQLAEAADLSLGGLGKIERGDGCPALDTLMQIANALGLSGTELLKESKKLKARP